MSLTEFAEKLFICCLRHGGSVTSWIRSEAHNKAIGGKRTSLHRVALGADVVLDDLNGRAAFISDVVALGLHFQPEDDHIHIQALPVLK